MLGHEIMWTGGGAGIAVPLVGRCRKAFPNLRGCSFDRGFNSPANRKKLDDLLDLNALPKKGELSVAKRERRSATGQLTLSTIFMPAECTGPASPLAAKPARIAAIRRSPICPDAETRPRWQVG